MATAATIIEKVAICINEPRGDYGLEGYQRGESYRCECVDPEYPRPCYFRVYPSPEHPDYYECAIPRHFTRYFHVEEKAS